MKKINIISAIFMGVVLFSTPAQAETIKSTVITDLNLRQYPSRYSKIITVLPEGTEVEALECSNPSWSKIEFEDYVGYVYNAYLSEFANKEASEEGTPSPTSAPTEPKITRIYSNSEFQWAGVINWNGWNWTYYLMSQFPGETSTPCPGRYVNSEGFVCDPDGYIILASADLAPYAVVETPFGYMGKVYDTGCGSGVLDVYTNW